jgi:hypothetical protein
MSNDLNKTLRKFKTPNIFITAKYLRAIKKIKEIK